MKHKLPCYLQQTNISGQEHPVSVLPNDRPQKSTPSSAYDVSSRVYSQASMRQKHIKSLQY